MKKTNLEKLSDVSSGLIEKLKNTSPDEVKAELGKSIAEFEKEIAVAQRAINEKKYWWVTHKNIQFFCAVIIAAAGVAAYALNFVAPIIEKDVLISKKNNELTEKKIEIQKVELKKEKIKLSEAEEKNKQLSKTLEKQKDEIEKYKAQMQTRISLALRQIEKLNGELESAKLESLDLQNLSSELAQLSQELNHTIIITVKRDSEFYPPEEASNGVSGFIKVSFEIDRNGRANAFQTIAQSTDGDFAISTRDVINNYLSEEPIQPSFLLNTSNYRWQAMVIYKAN